MFRYFTFHSAKRFYKHKHFKIIDYNVNVYFIHILMIYETRVYVYEQNFIILLLFYSLKQKEDNFIPLFIYFVS